MEPLMPNQISKAARELLELEQKQALKPFSEEEQLRWDELAMRVFSDDSTHGKRRRSFRLPGHTACTLNISGVSHQCVLIELSLRGFSISCKEAIKTPSDMIFVFESIMVLNKKIPIELSCKMINLKSTDLETNFGAELTSRNGPQVLEQYFEKIYYPLYISYLEGLSNG